MLPIGSVPSILFQLKRLERVAGIPRIVVATSKEVSDNQLTNFVQNQGFQVFRGDLERVLIRFQELLLDQVQLPEYFVRITADCPLISPELIREGIEIFQSENLDYLSNTLSPHFPDGMDYEIVRSESFMNIESATLTNYELEHVTPFLYQNSTSMKLGNMVNAENLSPIRVTLDTSEDYEKITKLVNDYEIQDGQLLATLFNSLLRVEEGRVPVRPKITNRHYKEYNSTCEW